MVVRLLAVRWWISWACALAALGVAQPALAALSSPNPAPDLILITVDTLRADALGFAGHSRVVTPWLDRLAAGGRIYPHAHAHNVVTLPSHANILTGFYPFQHGVRENSGFVLPAQIPTVATLLRQAGYATGAVVSGFPLDSRFGLAAGFDYYDDVMSSAVRDDAFGLAERRGDEAVAAARLWWSRSASPRFLWLHLFDPHAPYAAPEPFASRFAAEPYLGEVAAVDAYLGVLLEPFLAGRERPALIAFTADHGEALGEHGEATHGLFAYEATLAVPLVLWGHGVEPGRDLRSARHVDLFPTLLAAAGVSAPAAPAGLERPGRSLLAPEPRDPAGSGGSGAAGSYFEALSAALNRGWAPLRGWLEDGVKWIELPLPELYRLNEDPRELENRVDQERRLARALAARLPAASSWPPPRGRIRAEDEAQLAALGYVAVSAPLATRFGPEDDPKGLLDLDRQIADTIDAYSRGQYQQALALARAVVAKRPNLPLGRSLLAQALLEAGARDEALRVMRQARSEGVAGDALLRQLGLTLAETGAFAEAEAVLRPLVAAGDHDARCHLALTFSEAGRQEAAAAELAVVLAAWPDHARVFELKSLVALRLGRWAEARQTAERAIALAPGRPLAWNNLGVALHQAGERDAALDAWQQAVTLDPRQVDVWWNLGVQAARAGRVAQARAALAAFIARASPTRYGEDLAEARRLLAQLEGQ